MVAGLANIGTECPLPDEVIVCLLVRGSQTSTFLDGFRRSQTSTLLDGFRGKLGTEYKTDSRRIAGCLAARRGQRRAEQAPYHSFPVTGCARLRRRCLHASVATNASRWTAVIRRSPRRRRKPRSAGLKSDKSPCPPLRTTLASRPAPHLLKRDLHGRLALEPAP